MNSQKTVIKTIILCLLIAVTSLFLRTPAFTSTFIASHDFHTSMELSTSIFSIIFGIFCLVIFLGNKNILMLFLGTGYILYSFEGFFHGFFSLSIGGENPNSYIYGRLLLALFIVIGTILEGKIKAIVKTKKITFMALAFILLVIIPALTLHDHFHIHLNLKTFSIQNFEEFLLVILFLLSSFFCWVRLKKFKDVLSVTLVVSNTIYIIAQLYLSFGITAYTVPFIIAHTLLLLGSAVMLTGLMSYIYRQNLNLIKLGVQIKENEKSLELEKKQLLSIFDCIDDYIYVADLEKNKILFSNKSMNKAFKKNLTGEVCYKSIMGKGSPCSICSLNNIGTFENEVINGRIFTGIRDRIRWTDGRIVIFHLLSDITKIKETEDKLKENLSREKRVNSLMVKRERRVIEMKKEVNSLLEELGREIKYRSTDI